MKYKKGQQVRVRSDLEVGENFNGFYVDINMKTCAGLEAKIDHVGNQAYTIDIDREKWAWADEMLEPVTQQNRCVSCGRFMKDGHGCKQMQKQFTDNTRYFEKPKPNTEIYTEMVEWLYSKNGTFSSGKEWRRQFLGKLKSLLNL